MVKNTNNTPNTNDKFYIRVIGVDRKQHIAECHKEVCFCGVKILRKKLLTNDYNLYSCYECTF